MLALAEKLDGCAKCDRDTFQKKENDCSPELGQSFSQRISDEIASLSEHFVAGRFSGDLLDKGLSQSNQSLLAWIPAYAGMTVKSSSQENT